MSEAIYRMLLRFFPPELRRWEAEMADTFALQLADARAECGWRGALRVWCDALDEVLRIALPHAALIPLISLVSSGMIFFGLTWALQNSLTMLAAYRHIFDKLGG